MASRSSSGLGARDSAWTISLAVSSLCSLGPYTATSMPSSTPTAVGWTPLSSVAAHTPSPSSTYRGARQTRSHRSATISPTRTAAASSAATDRSSV